MDISIIVPTYNRKIFLENCLKSLFNQTYPKNQYEIIVVDDGSTDGTREMIKELKTDSNLRYFYQENQGPAAARNLGIKNAKGKIIAFIDSDCVADKDWLVNLIKGFNKNKKIAGVGGQIKALNPQNLIEKYSEMFMYNHKELIEEIKSEPPHLGTANCAYWIKLVKKIGLFDPLFRCGEDVDLSWRLYFVGYRFLYEPKAILFHLMPKTANELLRKCFIYGCAKTELLNKFRDELKEFNKYQNKERGLSTWLKRLFVYEQILAKRHRKKLLYLLMLFLNSLTYRSYRLGIFYQALKMRKK
jgi:glycosyltransferase involved in cell wall biosynthesis